MSSSCDGGAYLVWYVVAFCLTALIQTLQGAISELYSLQHCLLGDPLFYFWHTSKQSTVLIFI